MACVPRKQFIDPVDLVVDLSRFCSDQVLMLSGLAFESHGTFHSHDAWSLKSVLGMVVDGSARIANGQGTATTRFSERTDVEPIFRDIAGGIIRSVSVGYSVHHCEITKHNGAPELWRAVDWEPLEFSAVPIGADPDAPVRSDATRAAAMTTCTLSRNARPAGTATRAPCPEGNNAR